MTKRGQILVLMVVLLTGLGRIIQGIQGGWWFDYLHGFVFVACGYYGLRDVLKLGSTEGTER